MGMSEFFKKAAEYRSPDPATMDQEGNVEKQIGYHKRIVVVSSVFGIIGASLGVVFLLVQAQQTTTPLELLDLLSVPGLLGAVGLLFGAAMTCLFAPTRFLTGPMGKKWMKFLGTKNLLAARVVCLIFCLIIMAPFIGLLLMFVFEK